jgi:hypothetical protein
MQARSRYALILVAAVSMILVGTFATTATAVPPKSFAADITQCAPAGATAFTFTVTLRNETSTQMLGSADVFPPSGFPSGTPVELRNLNLPPGGSTTQTFQADTPAAGAYVWTVIAKQSNDYNGSPGNNLTFDAAHSHLTTYVGTCVLNFVTQPATTKVGASITSQAANPSGTPVKVEVLSGTGGSRITTFTGPVSLALSSGAGTLNGGTAVNAVGGLATFGNDDNKPGFSIDTADSLDFRDRLSASGDPGIASATSNEFDITDDAVLCTGNGCNGNASKNNVSVNVAAPLAHQGDVLLVALDVEPIDCANYTELIGTPEVTFSVSGSSYRVVTIVVPAALATRPASQDFVCYSSAVSFVDRSGNTVPAEGSGLLPDCKSKTPLSAPCQFPTTVDKVTGDHTVSFRAPAGSTRGHT